MTQPSTVVVILLLFFFFLASFTKVDDDMTEIGRYGVVNPSTELSSLHTEHIHTFPALASSTDGVKLLPFSFFLTHKKIQAMIDVTFILHNLQV